MLTQSPPHAARQDGRYSSLHMPTGALLALDFPEAEPGFGLIPAFDDGPSLPFLLAISAGLIASDSPGPRSTDVPVPPERDPPKPDEDDSAWARTRATRLGRCSSTAALLTRAPPPLLFDCSPAVKGARTSRSRRSFSCPAPPSLTPQRRRAPCAQPSYPYGRPYAPSRSTGDPSSSLSLSHNLFALSAPALGRSTAATSGWGELGLRDLLPVERGREVPPGMAGAKRGPEDDRSASEDGASEGATAREEDEDEDEDAGTLGGSGSSRLGGMDDGSVSASGQEEEDDEDDEGGLMDEDDDDDGAFDDDDDGASAGAERAYDP